MSTRNPYVLAVEPLEEPVSESVTLLMAQLKQLGLYVETAQIPSLTKAYEPLDAAARIVLADYTLAVMLRSILSKTAHGILDLDVEEQGHNYLVAADAFKDACGYLSFAVSFCEAMKDSEMLIRSGLHERVGYTFSEGFIDELEQLLKSARKGVNRT